MSLEKRKGDKEKDKDKEKKHFFQKSEVDFDLSCVETIAKL
jgi:hypothetical protein